MTSKTYLKISWDYPFKSGLDFVIDELYGPDLKWLSKNVQNDNFKFLSKKCVKLYGGDDTAEQDSHHVTRLRCTNLEWNSCGLQYMRCKVPTRFIEIAPLSEISVWCVAGVAKWGEKASSDAEVLALKSYILVHKETVAIRIPNV
jgi:hypothetical protein